MQKRFDSTVDGDFNIIVNISLRRDLLNELMAMFDLQIANIEEFVGNEHQWIFCSSGKSKRRINFVFNFALYEISLMTTASALSNVFDLGSDHRAI